ncbi:hypothetical protein GIB67_023238, partial [Kingdonia uniflora]
KLHLSLESISSSLPTPSLSPEFCEINLLLSSLHFPQIFLRLVRKDMGFPSHNLIIGNPNLVGAKNLVFAAFLSLDALKIKSYEI